MCVSHLDTIILIILNTLKKEPVEALLRSLLLVLMDNGTAEYAFITRFFDEHAPILSPVSSPVSPGPASSLPHEFGGFNFAGHSRTGSVVLESPPPLATPVRENITKEHQVQLDTIWKQVMDPVLEYTQVGFFHSPSDEKIFNTTRQTFARGILEASPATIPLLIMIRLLENVLGEVQKRDCPPLEHFTMGLRLSFWPAFQKDMNAHIESVKKMADGAGGGGFLSGKTSVRDATVQAVNILPPSIVTNVADAVADCAEICSILHVICNPHRKRRRNDDILKVGLFLIV